MNEMNTDTSGCILFSETDLVFELFFFFFVFLFCFCFIFVCFCSFFYVVENKPIKNIVDLVVVIGVVDSCSWDLAASAFDATSFRWRRAVGNQFDFFTFFFFWQNGTKRKGGGGKRSQQTTVTTVTRQCCKWLWIGWATCERWQHVNG